MLQSAPVVAYIPAADLTRARAFYEGKLQFTPKESSRAGVMYECAGGTQFFLYVTPNAGTSKASTAFWDVKDVVAEKKDLESRGVVFESYDMPDVDTEDGIATGGGAKVAWFKDTEGNILAIAQRI